jgi:hypothetical protein
MEELATFPFYGGAGRRQQMALQDLRVLDAAPAGKLDHACL